MKGPTPPLPLQSLRGCICAIRLLPLLLPFALPSVLDAQISEKGIALRHNRQLVQGGSWSYIGDFEAGIRVAGAQSVHLLRPDGGLTVLATYDDPDWWTVREAGDHLPTFQSRFADGLYTFRVTFPDAAVVEVPLDTRIIPMPGEYPELSGIQAEVQWPANTPLPLQWRPWTVERQGNDVMLFVENQSDGNNQVDYVTSIEPSVTNHVVPGSALPDNSRFHAWVHFANWSTDNEVVKQTASHVDFHTGTPQEVLGYDVDLMQDWMPLRHGNWYRYLFEAEIETSGASRVMVTTPAKAGFPGGETLDLHNNLVGARQEWWLEVLENSPALLNARFPDGVYTYTVWFINGSNTTVTCEAAAAWPPSFPQPTPETPVPHSTVDPDVPITLGWAPWIHTNTTDRRAIYVMVNEFAGGNEIIDLTLPATATSCTIPSGTFRPGGRYFVTIEFESFIGDGNDKDMSLILQYTTSPSIVPASVRVLTNGHFQFEVSSLPGAVLDIQASTNLTHWETIGGLTNTTGFAWFTDTSTNFVRRFFRLKLADWTNSTSLEHDSMVTPLKE